MTGGVIIVGSDVVWEVSEEIVALLAIETARVIVAIVGVVVEGVVTMLGAGCTFPMRSVRLSNGWKLKFKSWTTTPRKLVRLATT